MACEGMHYAVEPSLLPRIKADYIKGKGSVRQIAEKYGADFDPLRVRASKEGWTQEREKYLESLSRNSLKRDQNRASEWEDLVFNTSKEDFLLITESIRQLKESGQGIDSEHIGGYARARKLLDDMARRSLGLTEPVSRVDVTSGGKSIGENLVEAISALRGAAVPKLEDSEVQRILEAEIVEE